MVRFCFTQERLTVRLINICLSIFVFAALAAIRADDELPKRLEFNRYNGMVKQSPFAVATAMAAPAATPNFAKDLYIANAAKSPEGDMVTVASSADKEFKKYLTTNTPVDGYGIASIEWSDKVGETKVTISKDGQFATLSFNQAVLLEKAQNRPPAPQPIQTPMQNLQRQSQAPPPLPGGTPHVRGLIPRNPSANQNPTPFQIPPPSSAQQ
jgi:hypothetical protein